MDDISSATDFPIKLSILSGGWFSRVGISWRIWRVFFYSFSWWFRGCQFGWRVRSLETNLEANCGGNWRRPWHRTKCGAPEIASRRDSRM